MEKLFRQRIQGFFIRLMREGGKNSIILKIILTVIDRLYDDLVVKLFHQGLQVRFGTDDIGFGTLNPHSGLIQDDEFIA